MAVLEIVRREQQLESLFDHAQTASGGDLELLSHWGKYLCVLSSGFLEVSLVSAYSHYAADCHPHVGRFAVSRLRRIQNPKAQRFVEVAHAFRPQWGEELEVFLSDEGRKEAIDGIMANRHQIAHGRNCDITVATCKDYFKRSVSVLGFIIHQLDL